MLRAIKKKLAESINNGKNKLTAENEKKLVQLLHIRYFRSINVFGKTGKALNAISRSALE